MADERMTPEAVQGIRQRLAERKPGGYPNITGPFTVRHLLDGGAVICGREVRDGTDFVVPFAKTQPSADPNGSLAEYIVRCANRGDRLAELDEDDVAKLERLTLEIEPVRERLKRKLR